MTDVGVAVLFPELLGTYGDGGNATVLAQRLRWRGLGARVLEVRGGDPVPEGCEIYLLGGGEDGPQSLAVRELEAGGALQRAVDSGAAVFAVCAGFQILGRRFVGPDGREHGGLGLLDCRTERGRGRRMVGELLVAPDPSLDLPTLTGYENHAGVTTLGPDARPLGTVVVGHGNGTTIDLPERAGNSPGKRRLGRLRVRHHDGMGPDQAHERRTEGIVSGRVVGTYLHGPALARNPALADLLLTWVVGRLDPIESPEVEALRAERLVAARAHRRSLRTRHLR